MKRHIGACLLATAWAAGAVHHAGAQSMEARQLMQATNEDRARQGLGPLKWDPALARAAQKHAQLMVGQSALSHQYAGEEELETRVAEQGAHFRVVAENLAAAPTPIALEAEWMHSPHHRANILDARLNEIGIGIVRQGNNLWAVEDFSAGVASMGSSQIERQIEVLLTERGLHTAGDVNAARQTCAMDHGSVGAARPRFIMRWQASDLTRLPEVLEDRIATGKYRTATVGACNTGNGAPGFTTYHMAVLLF
jgi:Cysteine-rich secretory protein family